MSPDLEQPPEREEWGHPSIGEAMHRLHHGLERCEWVESVDWKPGGALDAAIISLRQHTGTVPREVVQHVHEAALEVRSVGGYMTLTVSAPERRGGDLEPEQEVSSR